MKRWTPEEISKLKSMAQNTPTQRLPKNSVGVATVVKGGRTKAVIASAEGER